MACCIGSDFAMHILFLRIAETARGEEPKKWKGGKGYPEVAEAATLGSVVKHIETRRVRARRPWTWRDSSGLLLVLVFQWPVSVTGNCGSSCGGEEQRSCIREAGDVNGRNERAVGCGGGNESAE